MRRLTRRFLRDAGGVIQVEYGIVVSLIAVASILALAALGDALDQGYESTVEATTQHRSLPGALDF